MRLNSSLCPLSRMQRRRSSATSTGANAAGDRREKLSRLDTIWEQRLVSVSDDAQVPLELVPRSLVSSPCCSTRAISSGSSSECRTSGLLIFVHHAGRQPPQGHHLVLVRMRAWSASSRSRRRSTPDPGRTRPTRFLARLPSGQRRILEREPPGRIGSSAGFEEE